MRISGLLSFAAVALLASGCGVLGSSPAPTVSLSDTGATEGLVPRPTDEPPVTPAPREEGPTIDGSSHNLTAWSSPSGNTVCAAFRESATAPFEIRCDVLEHVWKLPPKPANCEFDWGRGTFLNTKAGITCVSDSLIGKDAVGTESTWWNGQPGAQVMTLPGRKAVTLAYGASMTFGPLTCSSQLDGMHCTNSTNKAGFDISRTEYTLR